MDAAQRQLGLRRTRTRTKRLRLLGAAGHRRQPPGSLDAHLAGRYGSLASEVRYLVVADPALGRPLVAGLPYLRAEAVYAVRQFGEMAGTVDDVLTRRTRARLQDRSVCVDAAPAVADLLAG